VKHLFRTYSNPLWNSKQQVLPAYTQWCRLLLPPPHSSWLLLFVDLHEMLIVWSLLPSSSVIVLSVQSIAQWDGHSDAAHVMCPTNWNLPSATVSRSCLCPVCCVIAGWWQNYLAFRPSRCDHERCGFRYIGKTRQWFCAGGTDTHYCSLLLKIINWVSVNLLTQL